MPLVDLSPTAYVPGYKSEYVNGSEVIPLSPLDISCHNTVPQRLCCHRNGRLHISPYVILVLLRLCSSPFVLRV